MGCDYHNQTFLETKSRVRVVAHRGDWRNAPENSLQAIEMAIAMGVDMVEVDVALTKDSVLVLMHDETIDRTTNCVGKISDITYDSLLGCPLIDGLGKETAQRVPTLETVLGVVKGKIPLNLDKAAIYLPIIYHLLQKQEMTEQAIFSSYLPYDELRERAGPYLDSVYYMPKIRLETAEPLGYLQEYLENTNSKILQIRIPTLDYEHGPIIKYAKEAGLLIWINSLQPYHCAGHNDEVAVYDPDANWGWIVEQGADYIQTDRPRLLIDYLEEKMLR